jgi:uridine phosphorylase
MKAFIDYLYTHRTYDVRFTHENTHSWHHMNVLAATPERAAQTAITALKSAGFRDPCVTVRKEQ